MKKYEFDAVLEEATRGGVFVYIPLDVKDIFGTKGQVKVKTTIDGEPYKGSLAPMGGGRHVLGVLKAIRDKIGKKIGDSVHIVLEEDTEPRVVKIPEDFQAALEVNPAAKSNFEKMPYTHKKEYVNAIIEAKKPETRANRIEKAIKMILDWKKK